ncbi:MAG: DL-methionine transporter ATP-binding subunit [Legionellaceae bacterium]|nr:DL-methionine transporter ATP-binding subunit [Legionellaceae bacterium]
MIEIKQLNKQYHTAGQTVDALCDIDLKVQPGEIFGIIGKSGAGKSTLIRCVNLLEQPSSGEVVVNQQSLTTLSSSALNQARRKIGMIFQHFNLLASRDVHRNVALPLELIGLDKHSINKKVTSLLELVDLTDRANYFPSQLSGGQKQRVAIARALATDPDVLLCDEATSALDPESTVNVLQLLKKINRELKLTILLITHEMDVIKNICDQVAVLSKGKIIESGNVLDIFAEPKAEETKRLTQAALHLELPLSMQEKLQAEPAEGLNPVVRIVFVGESANEPIATSLQQKFNVSVNILQADLEVIKESTIGFTICQLIGDADSVKQSLDYLNQLKLKTEVLGYA